MEKQWYDNNEGGYKEITDALLKSSGMTLDEYWTTYEWYNAFRLVTDKNCYELAIQQGKEKGEITEDLKQADDFWKSLIKGYKEKAKVEIKDDRGLNLR